MIFKEMECFEILDSFCRLADSHFVVFLPTYDFIWDLSLGTLGEKCLPFTVATPKAVHLAC